MAFNIVSTIINMLAPSVLDKVAAALGVNSGLARTALSAAVPAVLAAFGNKASTETGARALFDAVGLRLDAACAHRLPADLDTVLSRSHGTDHGRVRSAFEASIGGHGLGVGAHRVGDGIAFAYPICGSRFVGPAGRPD